MTPHPVTVYSHMTDLLLCYPLMWNVTLEYTATHFIVLSMTCRVIFRRPSIYLKKTLKSHAIQMAFSEKLYRKYPPCLKLRVSLFSIIHFIKIYTVAPPLRGHPVKKPTLLKRPLENVNLTINVLIMKRERYTFPGGGYIKPYLHRKTCPRYAGRSPTGACERRHT